MRLFVWITFSIVSFALIVLNGNLHWQAISVYHQMPGLATGPFREDGPGDLPIEPTFTARIPFNVDPKTPLCQLLPAQPENLTCVPPTEVKLLTDVPEVSLFDPVVFAQLKTTDIAHQTAKINFLNAKGPDEFVRTLRENRPDLQGLPFAMGTDCRLSKEDWPVFASSVNAIHSAVTFARGPGDDPHGTQFWANFNQNYGQKTNRQSVAALMQIVAPEFCQPGLVQHLAQSTTPEATQALTRLAVFAVDEETRRSARQALKQRDPAVATPILAKALRYPWPDVARHAAEAIVELKRTDLATEMADLLAAPDPRAPVLQQMHGQTVPVVRELVRINHRRNCLLCHAPANTPDVIPPGSAPMKVGTTGGKLAGVPTPDTAEYYSSLPSPDVLVRTDVTYLRQDFSLFEKDAKANPQLQRFDYLVRSRVLSAEEAELYRAAFAAEGTMSPYRDIALDALRRLTGNGAH